MTTTISVKTEYSKNNVQTVTISDARCNLNAEDLRELMIQIMLAMGFHPETVDEVWEKEQGGKEGGT